MELSHYVCKTVSDAFNLEVYFKKLNLKYYVSQQNFDGKGYAREHLVLRDGFSHVPRLQDFGQIVPMNLKYVGECSLGSLCIR